jgi:RNA-directed DNA polymerase
LAFNEDKTRVVHLDDGFDFLGFNIRRYRGKLLIKPSKAAIQRLRKRLATEMLALRGANAEAVLIRLNPIIRGWSAYYRGVVSSEVFNALDDYVWKLTYKWARYSHANKSRHWIVDRYFGRFNRSRGDRWVFGDRDSGAYLLKFSWTRIVRHQLVPGTASPDDPALAEYWARRRQRNAPPLDSVTLGLLKAQHDRCPLCNAFLLTADHEPQSPEAWVHWLTVTRNAVRREALPAEQVPGMADEPAVLRLVHARCQRRHNAGNDIESNTASASP